MRKYFSYLDTATRIIHIYANMKVANSESINELLSQLKFDEKNKGHFSYLNVKEHMLKDPDFISVLIHEHLHFWQTFFYPFMYYLSCIEFRTFKTIQEDLLHSNNNLEIGNISVNNDINLNMSFLTYKCKFYKYDEYNLWVDFINIEQNLDVELFSITDIIENATSILQFNLIESLNNRTADLSGYLKWINDIENRCYKNFFWFIANSFNCAIAYRHIPVCVQLSFYTTEPLTAFCKALNYIIFYLGIEAASNKNIDEELFKKILIQLESTYGKFEKYDELSNILFIKDIPVKFIDSNILNDIIHDYNYHPIYHHGLNFQEITKATPEIEFNFSANLNKELFDLLMYKLTPIAICYNFRQLKSINNVSICDESLTDKDFLISNNNSLNAIQYIIDTIKVRDSVMTLLSEQVTNYKNNLSRDCFHKSCNYYNSELCWKWNSIPPDNHEDCIFPHYFVLMFKRKIDFKKGLLISVNEIEYNSSMEAYLTLQHEIVNNKKYRLIKYSDYYFLIIDENGIMVDEYFKESLLLISKKYKENDLIGKIRLDFDLDNERFWCDIPEIVTFFKILEKSMPHFLCFLEMKSHIGKQHVFDILIILSNGKFVNKSYEFKKEELIKVLKDILYAITNYCLSINKNPEEILLTIMSIFKFDKHEKIFNN